jgi:hypothetical protein
MIITNVGDLQDALEHLDRHLPVQMANGLKLDKVQVRDRLVFDSENCRVVATAIKTVELFTLPQERPAHWAEIDQERWEQ